MPALISLTTEDGIQLEVRVGRHPLTIGRAADNSVRSLERNVSRHHASIVRLPDGSYEVQDCGSSYGTFVNGAPVDRRALQHEDQLRMGALLARFALVPAVETDEPEVTTMEAREVDAARERVAALLEQQVDLRKEVTAAQHEEELARKERDEVEGELRRVRAELEKLRAQHAALEARSAKLDGELRHAQSQLLTSGDVEPLQKQLREARNLVEGFKKQIAGMEERDSQTFAQRKELARLTEELKQTRDRLVAATESVRPAMARIEALTAEVNQLRTKLTHAETELEDARKGR